MNPHRRKNKSNNTGNNKIVPKQDEVISTTPSSSNEIMKHTPKSKNRRNKTKKDSTATALMTVIITRADLLDGAAATLAETAQRLKHLNLMSSCWDLSKIAGDERVPSLTHSSGSSSNSSNSPPSSSISLFDQHTTVPVNYKLDNPTSNVDTPATDVKSKVPSAIILPFSYHPINIKLKPYHYPHKQKFKEIAVIRAPRHTTTGFYHHPSLFKEKDLDKNVPNPFPKVHDKYWFQRKRLFSKFDEGILLDAEGWFSVTPEVVADHVANVVGNLLENYLLALENYIHDSDCQLLYNGTCHYPYHLHSQRGLVLLDAFCGCGGNAIAFAKIPSFTLIVCIDIDRNKLRMAAHNASIYGIPPHKIIFIEANTLAILDNFYRDGVLQFPQHIQPEQPREICDGYTIGGVDLLPGYIDAVFMDPPWGGVEYLSKGKNGYDLQKNIRIPYQNRILNGFHLLEKAANCTLSKITIYDLPRNTNKVSLGKAALFAGYGGNCKLEEHYINGRLKTVTAYFGKDFCDELL